MNTTLVLIKEEDIKDKIYYIRGQRVMIDSDLAKIYGYTTKAFNQQVQRNIERFDEDFIFKLTKEEYYEILRSQNVTLELKQGQYTKYLPYAFTEEGIYMLMTVLKGELAVKQSKALIRIFKSMKDYLISHRVLEQEYINNMVLEHDESIKYLKETFSKMKKNTNNKIFFKGDFFDAHLTLLEIFDESIDEIIIIDNYASKELLKILKNINKKIIIVSSNIDSILKEKYEKQYNNITFINNNSFHDRFIIIDRKKLYSCGASFKDLGKKCFSIHEIEDKIYLYKLLNEVFVV